MLVFLFEFLYFNKVYFYEGSLKFEVKWFGEVFELEDVKEGIQVFFEKRKF